MKKIIYFLLILNLGLLSCVDDASVRVMPEFNCKDTCLLYTSDAADEL